MIVEFFKKDALLNLKNNTLSNLKNYRNSDKWVYELIDKATGIGTEDLDIETDLKSIKLRYSDKDDFQNAKLIYNALKNLTPLEASNEQFWAYLAHDTFWDYMKNRWSADKAYAQLHSKKGGKKEKDKNIQNYIKERYFFSGNPDRSLMRNGISRLWWYAYCSYDDTKTNPYELTEILLSTADIAQQIVERTYSRNRTITLGILDALKQYKDNGFSILGNDFRNNFRQAMKMLTSRSGVNVLDFMKREEVSHLVLGHLMENNKPNNSLI